MREVCKPARPELNQHPVQSSQNNWVFTSKMAESPLDKQDVLYGFDMRGRSEPIRMMYHIRGEKFIDHRVKFTEWEAKYKPDTPLGALPVLKTKEGTFNQSNCIARYVARKLGFMGDNSWEETLHDVVLENLTEATLYVSSWLSHAINDGPEPPKNREQMREFCVKVIGLVQGIAEKRGRKYIVGDEIGLAEVWLYTMLQYWKIVFPKFTDLSPWLKDFEAKMEAEGAVELYLQRRPERAFPDTIQTKFDKLKMVAAE